MVTEEEKQEIIKEYRKKISMMGNQAVKEKYGNQHYKNMIKARWDKYRANKQNENQTQ